MSKGCLSQKYGPVLMDLCWQKGVKRNTPCFLCIGSFAGVCSGLVKGSQIFRELGFAHLVGVEHGIGKCCNICQL